IASIRDAGETPLGTAVKNLVPGVRLGKYKRTGSPKSKTDYIDGEFDSLVAARAKTPGAVSFTAELQTETSKKSETAESATPSTDTPAAGETRIIKLAPNKNNNVPFVYPYLSPGVMKLEKIDDQGNLIGQGTITPTIPILDKLAVRFQAGRDGK